MSVTFILQILGQLYNQIPSKTDTNYFKNIFPKIPDNKLLITCADMTKLALPENYFIKTSYKIGWTLQVRRPR